MVRRVRELREREEGFTLIELLIVIVILGILAAIVVFSVNAITSRGANSACKSDAKSVEVAQEAAQAQDGSYAGSVAALVSAGYLRSAPPDTVGEATNDYYITTSSTGVVTTHNTQGTADVADDTTSTDASNCPA